jgi:hypothetical protein
MCGFVGGVVPDVSTYRAACFYLNSQAVLAPFDHDEICGMANNIKIVIKHRENTVKYVRAQRIKWWGHPNRIEKAKDSKEDYGVESYWKEI